MSKRVKLFALLAALIMCAAAFVACGGDEGKKAEKALKAVDGAAYTKVEYFSNTYGSEYSVSVKDGDKVYRKTWTEWGTQDEYFWSGKSPNKEEWFYKEGEQYYHITRTGGETTRTELDENLLHIVDFTAHIYFTDSDGFYKYKKEDSTETVYFYMYLNNSSSKNTGTLLYDWTIEDGKLTEEKTYLAGRGSYYRYYYDEQQPITLPEIDETEDAEV